MTPMTTFETTGPAWAREARELRAPVVAEVRAMAGGPDTRALDLLVFKLRLEYEGHGLQIGAAHDPLRSHQQGDAQAGDPSPAEFAAAGLDYNPAYAFTNEGAYAEAIAARAAVSEPLLDIDLGPEE